MTNFLVSSPAKAISSQGSEHNSISYADQMLHYESRSFIYKCFNKKPTGTMVQEFEYIRARRFNKCLVSNLLRIETLLREGYECMDLNTYEHGAQALKYVIKILTESGIKIQYNSFRADPESIDILESLIKKHC